MPSMMTQNCGVGAKTEPKRKRVIREANELSSDDERQYKRQSKQKSTGKPVYAQLPTPDESSEDEDAKLVRNTWYSRRNINNLAKIRTGSMSSVRVHLGQFDSDDDVMIMSPLTPSLSNSSISSAGRYDGLCPPPTPFDERIPTPTTNTSYSRRTWHSHQLQTTCLSPLTGEDDVLASPMSPMSKEYSMEMDAASDCLSGLSVRCADSATMEMEDTPTSASQGCGRTAKLHMGYRDDCEKCVKKVPGHYSHIMWSS